MIFLCINVSIIEFGIYRLFCADEWECHSHNITHLSICSMIHTASTAATGLAPCDCLYDCQTDCKEIVRLNALLPSFTSRAAILTVMKLSVSPPYSRVIACCLFRISRWHGTHGFVMVYGNVKSLCLMFPVHNQMLAQHETWQHTYNNSTPFGVTAHKNDSANRPMGHYRNKWFSTPNP